MRRSALAVLLVAMFMVAPSFFAGDLSRASSGGVGPMAGPFGTDPVWADSLDDLSHVYVPVGGLVGVEVLGGEAHLKATETDGWVASSVIACPPGYRYDMAYVDVDAPGDSKVLVTVLDATKDPEEVGYANMTVANHVKVEGVDHSLDDIGPTDFPEIRIQVNLQASGADRPRLLAWTVFFIKPDEWRDEFLGTSRMQSSARVNVTGGQVTINTGMRNTYTLDYADYQAYPPVLTNEVDQLNLYVFYPNAGHTAYGGRTTIGADVTLGSVAGDLDLDGFTDAVVSANRNGMDYTRNSMILWGDPSGAWSTTGATLLPTDSARRPALGDVNGDGLLDVLFCGGGGTTASVAVFLNPGGRTWPATADVSLPGSNLQAVQSADLDRDGFDDVVLAEAFSWSGGSYSRAYMGGPSGPDATADIHFKTGSMWDVDVQDYNGDGFPDVAFACNVQVGGQDRTHVWISSGGSFDGNASTYQLDVPWSNDVMNLDSGDINGDGWLDLAYGRRGGMGQQRIYVFWGSASGFSNTARSDPQVGGSMNDCVVIDVDKDGYADVIGATRYQNRIDVYKGGASGIDGTADLTLNSNGPNALAMGVGRERLPYMWGSFTTSMITRPVEKRWDILVLEGDLPPGTEVRVTVLDNSLQPVLGFSDMLGPDVDLHAITVPVIALRVTLRSPDFVATPRIDRLLVKWMDANVWREEFYGMAKVDSTLGLKVALGELVASPTPGAGPEILIANGRTTAGYSIDSYIYRDSGGMDYLSAPPVKLQPQYGAAGADVGDFDGDGWTDVTLAVPQSDDTNFAVESAVFLGTPVGWRSQPDYKFQTRGARDVLVRDLNGDGRTDIVFAEEQDGSSYIVNSSLYWGAAEGWGTTPDLQFMTSGANGVAAADFNGDGRLDLAFACYRDAMSTSTDSMVFLQGSGGSFCGTVPDHRLATRGARAVAAADINGDTLADLAFANSFAGGAVEIDSYVYWGKAGGGFVSSPATLPTSGAEDVKVADLDGDSDMDVVFANAKGNSGSYLVDSFIYLNGGGGSFPSSPNARVPTVGAYAVAVADIDGVGLKDLVFACGYNGTSFSVPSRVFLGGVSAWSSTPDIELPSRGASDVVIAHMTRQGSGGYLSRRISPEKPSEVGSFDVFRYTARLGPAQGGRLTIIDDATWEVLAETTLKAGTNELALSSLFRVREHPAVRVLVSGTGLDSFGEFALDDLWLNWTARVRLAPKVVDLAVSPARILRTQAGEVAVNVTDEYDLASELRVVVEHQLNGTTTWGTSILGTLSYRAGAWRARLAPRMDVPAGVYNMRVNVTDTDSQFSGWLVFPGALVVVNNVPGAPAVHISPAAPVATSTLQAVIDTPASDVETTALMYRYRWFRDGVLVPELTVDTVPMTYLRRGENWSLEVAAFDGDDEGPAGTAWVLVRNASPMVKRPLPNPELMEDTPDDRWIDLSTAFEDADGDTLSYTVSPTPENITVTIDPSTGKVTMRPKENWFGQQAITFVASDGELSAWQTILVTVTSVNDIPRIVSVNGAPVTTDPVVFTVQQGELLVIKLGIVDVEGDELALSINSTAVTLDEAAREIRFQPSNDAVGTLRFGLAVNDAVTPSAKVRLNFTIVIQNKNDPPNDPRITNPVNGQTYKWNQTISLIAIGSDPDTVYGQVLNFTWSVNGTPRWYGSSNTVRFLESGNFTITLTVFDGEFGKSTSVNITISPKETITPPPIIPPEEREEPFPYALVVGIIVAICVVLLVAFLVVTKRREEAKEEKEETDEKREAFKRMAEEVKATADQMEAELVAGGASATSKVVVEQRAPGGEPAMVTGEGMEDRMLSMRPQETEAASRETMQLFKSGARVEVTAQDAEQLRIDNEKRKYATAIGRMPYGIPSAELKDRDWNDLAAALATGRKKTLPDGREVTAIDGRWYYSDPGDSSSFLKEHGAKPKMEVHRPAPAPAAAAAPTMSRAELMAKLEERLILGEISEETYRDLKRKYEAMQQQKPKKPAASDEWEEADKTG